LLLNLYRPQALAGLKADALALGDRNGGTRLNIPPGSPLPGSWLEDAKPSDLDTMTIEQGLLHLIGEYVHYLEGGGPRAGMHLHQGIGDVDLDHR